MKTIVIILAKDGENLEAALEDCHNLLGSLNTEMYGDGYPIILYNKELTAKENTGLSVFRAVRFVQEIISSRLYGKYNYYTLFLECTNEVIKKIMENENFFYVNAMLYEYGKNSRNVEGA